MYCVTIVRRHYTWRTKATQPSSSIPIQAESTETVSREPSSIEPRVIPRAEHTISRSDISEAALKVLYRLNQANHAAHLVGGAVRDLLLGQHPKDFDIATDASPEEVHKLFRNSRLIGRRFRLAHVRFGRDIIEVATFRGGQSETDHPDHHADQSGRILRDNVYGSLEEDAFRRDFTVNALYYNIADFSVIDHVDGMADLKKRQIRLIGDPVTRYREDPVRMLRAVRFATKLDFTIAEDTRRPIPTLAPLLDDIPPARLFEEVLKLFMAGKALPTFLMLEELDLFRHLFPATARELQGRHAAQFRTFIEKAMANTDRRVAEELPITPFFLFAVLMWPEVRMNFERNLDSGEPPHEAMHRATDDACRRIQDTVSLPRRYSTPMREIFVLQNRFENRVGKRAQRLLAHPRFRAAYDFLVLRAESGQEDPELANYWTEFQKTGVAVGQDAANRSTRSRPRRRRSRAKPAQD